MDSGHYTAYGPATPPHNRHRAIALACGLLGLAAVVVRLAGAGVGATDSLAQVQAPHPDLLAAFPAQERRSASGWTPFHPDPSVLKWTALTESNLSTGLAFVEAVGELTVPLVHGDDDSPRLTLQVMLRRFASHGARKAKLSGHAPRGVVVGHCGGPGSDAGCGVRSSSTYVTTSSPAASLGYDVLGISQRGVAPNIPGMTCEAITGGGPRFPPGGRTPSTAEISNGCPCAYVEGGVAGYMWKNIDTSDVESVRGVFLHTRQTSDSCFASPYWQLRGGRNKTYHFLEHVGTQTLLSDLELLRRAMGEKVLNFYGASYGTEVAAACAPPPRTTARPRPLSHAPKARFEPSPS